MSKITTFSNENRAKPAWEQVLLARRAMRRAKPSGPPPGFAWPWAKRSYRQHEKPWACCTRGWRMKPRGQQAQLPTSEARRGNNTDWTPTEQHRTDDERSEEEVRCWWGWGEGGDRRKNTRRTRNESFECSSERSEDLVTDRSREWKEITRNE